LYGFINAVFVDILRSLTLVTSPPPCGQSERGLLCFSRHSAFTDTRRVGTILICKPKGASISCAHWDTARTRLNRLKHLVVVCSGLRVPPLHTECAYTQFCSPTLTLPRVIRSNTLSWVARLCLCLKITGSLRSANTRFSLSTSHARCAAAPFPH
jgi:hypothetical protein